jgi:uncharacterized protein (TIGR00106 family)
MLAEFAIYPLGEEHLAVAVARAVEVLRDSGLAYRVGPLSTCVEGDWDRVLAAIRRCHEQAAATRGRVVTTITIDDHKGRAHGLEEMLARVEGERHHRSDWSGVDPEC